MSASSERMRVEWKESDAKRDAGLKAPEDVERICDVSYGKDPVWNQLDLYLPKKREEKLSVIVSVHGGGWVYGDKNLYQYYCMGLAQRGFAVVNFSYRLAPESKFPAQLEDTNAVLHWVFAHAEQYGLDLANIFMVGDSAGAHLLGLYSAICADENYAARYDFQVPEGFVPRAIGMNCGVFEPICPETVIGREEDKELMEDLLPGKGNKEEAELISVLCHVTEKFPPVFLMTAVGDFCKDQAPKLLEKLEEKHVLHEYHIYGDEKQPLYHVFHVTMQEPLGQKCNDEECAFFRSMRIS